MQGLFSAHTTVISTNRALSSSRLALAVPCAGLNTSACGRYPDIAVCPRGQVYCLRGYTDCAIRPGLALESTRAASIEGANEITLNQLTRKCTSARDCSEGPPVLGPFLHFLDTISTPVCYDGRDKQAQSLSPDNAPNDTWTSETLSSEHLLQVHKLSPGV